MATIASRSQGENSRCAAKPRTARAKTAMRTRMMIAAMVIGFHSRLCAGQRGVRGGCAYVSSLPPPAATVDRDQPGSHPDVAPQASGSSLGSDGWLLVAGPEVQVTAMQPVVDPSAVGLVGDGGVVAAPGPPCL